MQTTEQTTEKVRHASGSIIACKGMTMDRNKFPGLSDDEFAAVEEAYTCAVITMLLTDALVRAGEHWLPERGSLH